MFWRKNKENKKNNLEKDLEILENYLPGLRILEKYDDGSLENPKGNKDIYKLTYNEAREYLNKIKEKEDFGTEFAKEREEGIFQGTIESIYQTFDGEELHKSAEEKAVNLFYQIIKNHPFVDGNKKSAAALFVYYLSKNNILKNIDRASLAAFTLLIAISDREGKEEIMLFIRNFLTEK